MLVIEHMATAVLVIELLPAPVLVIEFPDLLLGEVCVARSVGCVWNDLRILGLGLQTMNCYKRRVAQHQCRLHLIIVGNRCSMSSSPNSKKGDNTMAAPCTVGACCMSNPLT